MSVATFPETPLAPGEFNSPLKEWTVDEYHQLIKYGILQDGAPIELLDGMLVYKNRGEGDKPMTYGPRHALLILLLSKLDDRVAPHHHHVRMQLPLTIRPRHEPEPDALIVRGTPFDYASHNPAPSDCCIVIEVADSSLEGDRRRKQRIYAGAAIPVYWIINLRNNTVEVYEQPDAERGEYRVRRDRQRGETIDIALPGGAMIPVCVNDLLG